MFATWRTRRDDPSSLVLLAVNPEGARLIEPPVDDPVGLRLSEILTPANETGGAELICEALGRRDPLG